MNARLAEMIAAAAPPLEIGEHAVVALRGDGKVWNTGRTYGTARAAHARQVREMGDDRNAYVVKRHSAGTTVYLLWGTVLGTVPG